MGISCERDVQVGNDRGDRWIVEDQGSLVDMGCLHAPESRSVKTFDSQGNFRIVFSAIDKDSSFVTSIHEGMLQFAYSVRYSLGKFCEARVQRAFTLDSTGDTIGAGFLVSSLGEISENVSDPKTGDLIENQSWFSFDEDTSGGKFMRNRQTGEQLLYIVQRGIPFHFGENESKLVDVNFHTAATDAYEATILLQSGSLSEENVSELFQKLDNIYTYTYASPS